jgi:hypothetical protein
MTHPVHNTMAMRREVHTESDPATISFLTAFTTTPKVESFDDNPSHCAAVAENPEISVASPARRVRATCSQKSRMDSRAFTYLPMFGGCKDFRLIRMTTVGTF